MAKTVGSAAKRNSRQCLTVGESDDADEQASAYEVCIAEKHVEGRP